MNYLIKRLLGALFLLVFINVKAADGDTTTIRVIDNEFIDWYGNFFGSGNFNASKYYRQITLKISLGCPGSGCSDWDYTTALYIQDSTGVNDSTLNTYPNYLLNGNQVDSIFVSTDTTYNVGVQNDSSLAEYVITQFGDLQNPEIAIDTLHYFRGNFYSYTYDESGNKIDSTWNSATDTLVLETFEAYDVFEVIDEYEIGRLITPYGGNWSDPVEQVYEIDITDFRMLLKNDVSFKFFYGGWSAGWNLSVDIEMIEGVPPRKCTQINKLWQGEFKYGVSTDPIADRITPQTVDVSNADELRMRSMITGHSFGGNENCAEFCAKTHQFVIGNDTYEQSVMRECGFNPVYPQNGTWVYDRAGWCPGLDVNWFEYELTDKLQGNDELTIDYQFEDYTYNGGASYDPNYRVTTYLFQYEETNFETDAAITDIIAPSTKTAHSRVNPMCGAPIVKIKNTGKNTIGNLMFRYGLEGGEFTTYKWWGELKSMESKIIELPVIGDLLPSVGQDAQFIVELSEPNEVTDEYAANNRMTSIMERTDVVDQQFKIYYRTNFAPEETQFYIINHFGDTLVRGPENPEPSTEYEIDVDLGLDCYTFVIEDNGGDGINFWANNDGAGMLQFRRSSGGFIKIFNGDFGSRLEYQFAAGGFTNVEEKAYLDFVHVYPNPTTDKLFLDYHLQHAKSINLSVYDMNGKRLLIKRYNGFERKGESVNLSELANGIYDIVVESNGQIYSKKIVKQ
jgi:hypothetical protein